jgi:hypothetical protein
MGAKVKNIAGEALGYLFVLTFMLPVLPFALLYLLKH